MSNGRVARDFIEKTSTDLRTLFRTGEGWVPASCLLGVANLYDGIMTIERLRMRTPDTTLVGSGEADFAAGRLDMTIKADSAGSRIFALDMPICIAGDFKKTKRSACVGVASRGGSWRRRGTGTLSDPDAHRQQSLPGKLSPMPVAKALGLTIPPTLRL